MAGQRIVLVTGGSRGIGRAICEVFGKEGARVYFNYASNEAAAKETAELIAKAGGEGVAARVDVTKEAEVEAFVAQIVAGSGRLDVLVNNAGVTRDGLLVRMKEADWDLVLDTNLKGPFLCTKHVAKTMMKQRYGRIVNISSVVGALGNAGQANYVSTKAGIVGLTKAVARELASRGITVNAVAPGYVGTDMTNELPDKLKDALVQQIPLGHIGEPEDIAEAVYFLASDKAKYITGQLLHVNGGLYM